MSPIPRVTYTGAGGRGETGPSPFPRARHRFCREIVEAAGHQWLGVQYMAVVLGLKPLLDDWVGKRHLEEFKAACARYGLHVLADIQFVNLSLDRVPADVIGREKLTSTVAYGVPVEAKDVSGEVHVYVAKDKNLLRHGMWYPVIVGDRVIHPSFADTLRFGDLLGYPECCVNFFREHNNWSQRSTLYDAYRVTRGRPHLSCNPLLKDTWYSWIYHMPCSFRCAKTIAMTAKLRAKVAKEDGAFARAVDAALGRPYLVLFERDCIGFESARLKGARLSYRRPFRLEPRPKIDPVLRALEGGDALEISGRTITVYKGGRPHREVVVPLTSWAPRYMFVADFGDD